MDGWSVYSPRFAVVLGSYQKSKIQRQVWIHFKAQYKLNTIWCWRRDEGGGGRGFKLKVQCAITAVRNARAHTHFLQTDWLALLFKQMPDTCCRLLQTTVCRRVLFLDSLSVHFFIERVLLFLPPHVHEVLTSTETRAELHTVRAHTSRHYKTAKLQNTPKKYRIFTYLANKRLTRGLARCYFMFCNFSLALSVPKNTRLKCWASRLTS